MFQIENGMIHAPDPPQGEPVDRCDYCKEPLYAGDTVYHIQCESICEDCLEYWAKPYRKRL